MEKGICPACNGTKRQPCDSTKESKHYRVYSGYDSETHTLPCGNCGYGMFARPSGEVNLRPDGTPCLHNFVHDQKLGNCYNSYKCTHGCGSAFTIDSGD
jgi:hypothetical protein